MAYTVVVTYQGRMQCQAEKPPEAGTLSIGPASGPGFSVYHLWGAAWGG